MKPAFKQIVLCSVLMLGIALGNCLQCFVDLANASASVTKQSADPHACCRKSQHQQHGTPVPKEQDSGKQGCPLLDGDLSRAVTAGIVKVAPPMAVAVAGAVPVLPAHVAEGLYLSAALILPDPLLLVSTPLRI